LVVVRTTTDFLDLQHHQAAFLFEGKR